MTFAGANRAPRVNATRRLTGVSNYMRGQRPEPLDHGVPNFAQVVYAASTTASIWPSMPAARASSSSTTCSAPGVDPDAIRLRYAGTGALRVDDDGDARAPRRQSELRQPPPVVFQATDEQVHAHYVLHGDHEVGFALAATTARAALLIDP